MFNEFINYKINLLIIDISSMNYINAFNIILKLLINNGLIVK